MKLLSWTKIFLVPLLVVCFVSPPFALTALAATTYGPNETEADLNQKSNPLYDSARYNAAQNSQQSSGGNQGQQQEISGLAIAGEVVGTCMAQIAKYVAAWLLLWFLMGKKELWNTSQTISGWVNGLQAITTTSAVTEQFLRECLDALFWALANAILEMMLHSIAMWIQNGFEGGPTFLTDPEGFFTDIADMIAGEALFGGDLRVLCSPFQLQLQLNILLRYFGMTSAEKNYCKLSDVVTNVQNFLEGSFEDGGWPAWFTTSIQPRQNYWGSLIGVEGDIAFRISSRTGTLKGELNMADGFFNIRDKLKKYVAPGKFVQESVNKAFASGQERLTIADEVDEIVGAILHLLVSKVLGEGGLLGLGEKKYDSGSGTKASYLDLLQQDAQGFVPTKQELLAHIDALLLEAGANPAYAEEVPKLAQLRTEVEAINENNPNATTKLTQLSIEVQNIAKDMNMTDYVAYQEQEAQTIQNNNTTTIDGPTPPPSDALPNTPGNDPNGTTVQNGGTTNTETPNGDVDLPPPPPPPSGF